jgi:flagellar export protein FliJ
MKKPAVIASLSTLIDLRGLAVDKLTAELARKATMRERYRSNIDRMVGLCAGNSSTSQASLSIALSINGAHYKQAVLQMADTHRADLTLHEADMAVTQRALIDAARRREVLGQVLAQKQTLLDTAERRVDQRAQDDMGARQWLGAERG